MMDRILSMLTVFGFDPFNNTNSFKIYVKSLLYSKRIIREYYLSNSALLWLVRRIYDQMLGSIIPKGEMVGTIAGQYLGEPTTQLTLNTFHSAGIATKELTLGVSRMLEILEVTRLLKTPSLYLYTDDDTSQSLFLIRHECDLLECLIISNILLNTQLLHIINGIHTHLEEDAILSSLYEDRSLTIELFLHSINELLMVFKKNRIISISYRLKEVVTVVKFFLE